mgnify:CR=1 FL=1
MSMAGDAILRTRARRGEKAVITAVCRCAVISAAVSVGIIDGEARLDLPYAEDSRAEVDVNVVMTDAGEFVEVQGTAEQRPISRAALDGLLDLAAAGIADLMALQRAALA